ncbi:diguanylate cyclase [Aestuariibacter halophilus]|uniref:Diguanylate cyclase n=1 Tax=Fluctibacter halophilus TaxID=226011 RepID=A0ABS8GB64_9ALTE|nr:GGDEF domain-containing protein [Aestuariibacter halophilus]MCC2617301.1 diguanylate cyclase [Aestuariibacter halophilus]
MKQDIDVVVVIQEKAMANYLCHNIGLAIPGVRLVRVRTPMEVLPLSRNRNIKLLVIVTIAQNLNCLNVDALNMLPPKTMLLLLSSKHNSRKKCLSTVLFQLSEYLRRWPSQAATAEKTSNTENQEKRALGAMDDAVFNCNKLGQVTYLNSAAEQLTGLQYNKALGMPLSAILQIGLSSEDQVHTNQIEQLIAGNRTLLSQIDLQLIHPNSDNAHTINSVSQIHDKSGNNDGAVVVLHKVNSDYVKMYHQANYDWLTDLPNRALLSERLNFAISLANRHSSLVGLLFVDLDHFKLVNDSLGHEVGDQLLKSVSKRLVECVRTSDTVSRHGGDEFAILLTEVAGFSDCEQVARNILKAFNMPHQLGTRALVISLSIGISVYPFDATSGDTMFEHADQAMYLAKKKGRNRFEVSAYQKICNYDK